MRITALGADLSLHVVVVVVVVVVVDEIGRTGLVATGFV
jgi:hypothetical protein